MLKLNVSSGYLLHQLLQRRSRIATLHRLCRCRCRLLELLLLLSKRRSLVFASRGLKLLLYEWLLLLCLLLLLWTKTIPQVLMISPTGIISVGLRIILLLQRSEWLSRLHGRNINNLLCFVECGTCIHWMIKSTTYTTQPWLIGCHHILLLTTGQLPHKGCQLYKFILHPLIISNHRNKNLTCKNFGWFSNSSTKLLVICCHVGNQLSSSNKSFVH